MRPLPRHRRSPHSAGEPVRVARVISRLNVGGPAIQAITLTRELEPLGYDTVLMRGEEGPREGSMDDLAEALGVIPVMVRGMGREIGPADALALARLWWRLWRFKPDIVHTHAAKAGTLGRLAVMLLVTRRPQAVVHTFHGHSLSGYWSNQRNRVLRGVERFLARRTDVLVAVSEQVRDELLAMGIGEAGQYRVVPLGFDLSRFAPGEQERAARRARLRAEWGVPSDATLVTLVARLAPIKRVDRFLRVAAAVAERRPDARFAVVGDGELHDALRADPAAHALGDRLIWAGMRRDVPDVCFASDVVTLTSDNEGTPVSLIEAQAAGVPVVATRVGGAGAVVADAQLADPDDEAGMCDRVLALLEEPERASAVGRAGREHVLEGFSLDSLVAAIDGLYRRLLA
jgi:glycosyltransferase involved in cell wall biosynthesis